VKFDFFVEKMSLEKHINVQTLNGSKFKHRKF